MAAILKKHRYLRNFASWRILAFRTLNAVQKLSFQNPIWRTTAILKNVKCDISANVWLILMQFGTAMHISPPNLMGDQKFENFKIQDGADGAHLENQKIAISPQPFGRIWWNFAWRHISSPELTSCYKNQTFKNLRWRTAAILKIVKFPYISNLSTNFGEILYGDACYLFQPNRLPKIWKFEKFETPRLRTVAIFRNRKGGISRLSNFDKILHKGVGLASRP